MPRKARPRLDWKEKRDPLSVYPVILQRLRRNKAWIAKTWRIEPGAEGDSELAAKIEELSSRISSCWLMLRGPDRAASVARQKVNLREFAKRRDFSLAALQRLDPATEAAIANRYPGGRLACSSGGDPKLIEKATQEAIRARGTPSRGRPVGTSSLARFQFALVAASSFYEASGKKPTRVVDSYETGKISAFQVFCEKFAGLVPSRFLARKGFRPRVDELARLGIQEFREAWAEVEKKFGRSKGPSIIADSRMWSIAEERWLGNG